MTNLYPDSELDTCSVCGWLGTVSDDIWGKSQFFHKVPSTREGYFTFTDSHLIGVSS